jgi:hypothetical protein
MKTVNQKPEKNQENTEQINWAVVGPILALLVAAIIWVLF